jgi:hypothetical protein
MPDTRTREEVLREDSELIAVFQQNDEELSEDDAVEQAKDFVGDVESALRTLKDSRTNRISDLSDQYNVPQEMVEEYFSDYDDVVDE